MHVLENYRGEIYLRYVGGDMTREELRVMLRGRGVSVTLNQLRDKLCEWGYRKNITRAEALSAIRGLGEGAVLSAQNSPDAPHQSVNALEQVERYWKNHRREYRFLLRLSNARNRGGDRREDPTPLERPLQAPTSLRTAAKFQYDLNELVHQSFRKKDWRWQGNSLLIISSTNASSEKACIMRMIHGVDLACDAARGGNTELAQCLLDDALLAVDSLVTGQYHDNIPNILAKINDLNDRGFRLGALKMKRRVTNASQAAGNSSRCTKLLYDSFKDLELAQLGDLEERCAAEFAKSFEHYLGRQCYNSFVMEMNYKRRKLARDRWIILEDCLPCRFSLDAEFGETNARPLDVLRIRVETLYHRQAHIIPTDYYCKVGQDVVYEQILREAQELVDRAQRIVNDPWQHNYFLIKGLYYVGLAQYHFGEYQSAEQSLRHVLRLVNEEFSKVDTSGQFYGEVTNAQAHLSELSVDGGSPDESWEIISDSSNDTSDQSSWSFVNEF